MDIKAVCFDMDGTLIRRTDSVRYLCTLNGKADELVRIEALECDGSISWIAADHLKARLVKGLPVADVKDKFRQSVGLIGNIERVTAYLRERGIRSVLITAGPIQVARILGERFDFDGVYGSLYEVRAQKFTGKISRHLGEHGKVKCLEEFCGKNGISLDQCVAIGDSESDIEVFERCRYSIAINYSEAVAGEASEHIVTDDLSDVCPILERWLAE